MKAKEQEQRLLSGRNMAAGALLRDVAMPQMNTPVTVNRDPAGNIIGRSGGEAVAPQSLMTPSTRLGLETQVMGGPLQMYAMQQAAQAEASKPFNLGANERRFQGGRVVAENIIPKDATAFKPTNMQRPGTNDVRIARTQQDVDALANQGYALAGNSVPGAPASKEPDKPNFGRQDYWRGQVKPFADSATNARVQASKVGSSLDLGTGTGHIAAINALQKMIDEGAVVRDQDVALIQSAQSLAGRLGTQMETLKSGKILSPDLQEELRGVASSLENAIYQGVNERVSAYEPVMTEEGVKMDSVLPPQMRAMFTPKNNPGDALAAAKAAISNGADRAAVIQRLRDNGIDPRGL
jgi:hypothetical protein